VRITIVSDIHSNLEALDAVLADAGQQLALDAIWNAGDTVGYGPQPSEVIAVLEAHRAVSVAGNHDLVACGLSTTESFNRLAAAAAEWTAAALPESDRCTLASLPLVREEAGVTMVHGSLREPDSEYLFHADQAAAHFALQMTHLSIVGHTHIPSWFDEAIDGEVRVHRAGNGETLELGRDRTILNPGSVGQPRDGDPRAGYAIYDTERMAVTWRRVLYDIDSVQRKMRAAGLPRELIDRLRRGV
jgi:diadenosine tetraphosphatase ApaH/serine/threonine PP2A family protein phosphatase